MEEMKNKEEMDKIEENVKNLLGQKNKCDPSQYKDSILGIVDILGFKEFVTREGANAVKKISDMIYDTKIINEMSLHRFLLSNNIKHKMLSDTFIVYTDKVDAESAYYVMYALENFRQELLRNGFLCRGAIVQGKNYIRDDIMVSQAFINAYTIEQKDAIYPRIIVDESVIKIIKEKMDSNDLYYDNDSKIVIRNLVVPDFDERYIIKLFVCNSDIARYLHDDSKDRGKGKQKLFEDAMSIFGDGLKECIDIVHSNGKNSGRIVEKVNYYIKLYNETLRSEKERTPDLKVDYIEEIPFPKSN